MNIKLIASEWVYLIEDVPFILGNKDDLWYFYPKDYPHHFSSISTTFSNKEDALYYLIDQFKRIYQLKYFYVLNP